MRILFLNQFYIPDVAATGQLLADVAEELAAQGHEVHVICSRRTYSGGAEAFPAVETIKGVRIHRVSATGFGRNRRIGRILDWLSFYFLAIWRALRLPKIDVCVSLTTPPFIALVGLMLRRLRGTKVLVWTMDLYPEVAVAFDVLAERSLLRRLLARLSRRIYKAAVAIISLGEVMTDRLVEAGVPRDKITIVHNWVPHETVKESASFPPRSPTTISMTTLLYSGNFGLGHGLDTVLRAVHALNGDTTLRVLLVGSGKGLAEIHRLVEELGLPNIEFRLPVPLYGLSDLLASGDIHFVSQKPKTEGLIVPSKIYGTLAVGRPVLFIGPQECEVADIVRASSCGFVVAPGDVESTAQALSQLALDAELRRTMGQRARRYYEEKFGRERSVARIIDVIERAAGNGRLTRFTDR